jgi:alpha,alpha-trehalose phosphorylase
MAKHGRRAESLVDLKERPALERKPSVALRPITFEAVAFSVHGVFAETRELRKTAFKATLDDYLLRRQSKYYEPFFEFEESEYVRLIAGLGTYDGIRTFLASRNITIADGKPDDTPHEETVCGLGNKADRKFHDAIEDSNSLAAPKSTLALVQNLKDKGIRVGVVCMTNNADFILKEVGARDAPDCLLDPSVADAKGLKPFPEPDYWKKVADALGTTPAKLVVVGGSIPAMQAAQKAGVALAVAVSPIKSIWSILKQSGANVAIKSFEGFDTAEHLQRWVDASNRDEDGVVANRAEILQHYRRQTMCDVKISELFSLEQEWCIVEDEYVEKLHQLKETIFCLGNGFIAMRGNFEEGFHGALGDSVPGTYMNGFYESSPIRYAEAAYGYPEKHQTMLNVTNARKLDVYISDCERDDPVGLFAGEYRAYRRVLNMQDGTVTRSFTWMDHEQREVDVQTTHLVSFENKNVAVMKYSLTPQFDGTMTFTSYVDGAVSNVITKSDPRVGSALPGPTLQVINKVQEDNGKFGAVVQRTTYSNLLLACCVQHVLQTASEHKLIPVINEQNVEVTFQVEAQSGVPITLYKYISYFNSRDITDTTQLLKEARLSAIAAAEAGLETHIKKQSDYLQKFWDQSSVTIEGDPSLQQGVRFNMFHLLQSVGRDGKTNIGAKGLSGEGYEGHYFWDTEIYIFPFFLYTMPEICRSLLEYRYSCLDHARARAKELDHKGALYPWRTIMGDEASAYFPAGTAQYHINADIIYSLKRYVEATDDMTFLLQMGAEMLFETARFWVDIGNFRASDDCFVINMVTGPDEYTALVNNNCFTNLMAQNNLQYAVEVAKKMKAEHIPDWNRLTKALNLEQSEVDEWAKAAAKMFLPYDDRLKIYLQDDSFLQKKRWDIQETPREKFPLLLNFHPLSIYRYQVCKQADLLLAEFLLGERFSIDQKRRDFEYYDGLTTHDSSLSACIFAILAAELGHHDKAYHHFAQTARMDLDNHHHNTQHGIHTACMAGTWLSLTGGFAGMRTYNGKLSFSPWLPDKWEGYSFNIVFKGSAINVSISKDTVTYKLKSGKGLSFTHRDNAVVLSTDAPSVSRSLK